MGEEWGIPQVGQVLLSICSFHLVGRIVLWDGFNPLGAGFLKSLRCLCFGLNLLVDLEEAAFWSKFKVEGDKFNN